jgi:hypothetical protein
MDFQYQGRHPPMQLAAMTAQAYEEFATQDWLADSGANMHVTAESSNLTNAQPFDGFDTVGIGNGAGLHIQNIGSSLVCSPTSAFHNFLLKNILHCPNASANLLSINKFCKDNKCWFALTNDDFTVKDNLTGTVLLHGPSENGLYPIKLDPHSFNKRSGFTALLGVKTNDMVWHQRLGHPSTSVFQYLLCHHHLRLLSPVSPPSVCESCQLGKSKQLPYSAASRGSTKPLEVIHSDVWTSPVPSLSGCKFYIIFVDEFSRFSWLYPLFNKSDVLSCFIKFKLLVENLFDTKVKYFQSDSGGEYTSTAFRQFFTNNDNFHRLTCPHTSQQNGIAERKHHHIVETGLTLLAQFGLPAKYWVDSFLTSVFLINRLPTTVLQNQSPFSTLFKKEPDYTLLRSFGCLCYPLLRSYARHKLTFQSKPCIFLGYGANQRGYRCLEPQSQKVYLSRNVVFDESKFPSKSPTPIRLLHCHHTSSNFDTLSTSPTFQSPSFPSFIITTSYSPTNSTPHS